MKAALGEQSPSGAFYSPSGDSVRLQSLGVHEHWNNAADKKYTRNLNPSTGTGIGIGQSSSDYRYISGAGNNRSFRFCLETELSESV